MSYECMLICMYAYMNVCVILSREKANVHDNKYHEKATDSMINFEVWIS